MVALWCWYRGERFHGYQRQHGVPTVQGELLEAFARAGSARNPVVAGRTDKGVSARMQVLSLRLQRGLELEELKARLNATLPGDLGIHLVREVASGFHAAWSATSKEYRYQLDPTEAGDLDVLQKLAALVPGTRRFTPFHFKTSEDRPRTVTAVELLRTPGGPTLRFVGEGFGRHMVRMLVGAMLCVARAELTLDTFRDALERQQNFKCPTASAEPLTLWEVGYPSELDPFTPTERAAFDWPRPPAAPPR